MPPEKKARIQSAATKAYLTEAAWLRRAVDNALRRSGALDEEAETVSVDEHRDRVGVGRKSVRVYVRLRPDDRLMLKDRAAARGLPTGSYVSVLVRSHLRALSPLPQAELTALKSAVTELGTIGRNLNQIARAANAGGRIDGPVRGDLVALMRVCELLRGHVKDLLKANVKSWQVGHVDDES